MRPHAPAPSAPAPRAAPAPRPARPARRSLLPVAASPADGILPDAGALVGGTRMVYLNKVAPSEGGARVAAKLESMEPCRR